MSHGSSRLCQEVGGQEEQVNASEKGLESRQTKMKKHVLSVCMVKSLLVAAFP